MTAEEQLCYVEYYLAEHKGKLNTLTDFYLAVLWPKAVGQGGNDNFIVFDDDAIGDKKTSYWSNGTFHSEEGEYKANSKGVVYEQKGKTGGKTYVWEIRKKIEEVYKKGESFKNTISDCTCHENCSCDKKCIDLTDKVAWMSQFNKSERKNGVMKTDGCWRTSQKLLISAGLGKMSGYKTGMIVTALEDENHTKLTLTAKAKDGVSYIDTELEKGNPVLVGLNHTINYKHNGKIINADSDYDDPGTTDHYVVIVGRGCEEDKIFYRFYEVGTNWVHHGQSHTNKLFLDKNDHSLKGIPAHNKGKSYTVTQVRKNK
ncbi:hypothetical protein [Aquimarina aquimarini]|uniref:hypothetical protein n=1 Tax=Aquimarina aquimarini TaxID=1191734 RepID=UPI000D5626CC|nr:hypothetical protein [Aquimarina aquimarini]